MSYLKTFCNVLQDFLSDLSATFPEERDIKLYKSYTATMVNMNPKLVLNYFLQFVYPYKSQIMSQDEAFFLEKDYTEEIGAINEFVQVDMLQAMKLKTLWAVMTPGNKQTTWKYLKSLIVLAERAAGIVV